MSGNYNNSSEEFRRPTVFGTRPKSLTKITRLSWSNRFSSDRSDTTRPSTNERETGVYPPRLKILVRDYIWQRINRCYLSQPLTCWFYRLIARLRLVPQPFQLANDWTAIARVLWTDRSCRGSRGGWSTNENPHKPRS